ncbi:YkgJ family cysteine cluster protein [Cupriavidus sp. H39]|uniref:YkgJ family cysteine cluster protein n=1 Tax=Cupriavidus sp. H39 TaxID=3401635 RepID=UPI003D074B63
MVTQQDIRAVASSVVSFHCSACGKCCNSPPQLTLAELFRHQDRFVGALGMRRMQPAGNAHAADAAALASRLGHALPGGDYLMLAVQGLDYPSLNRCPALGDDNGCTIHTSRPSTCALVPLDAWTPDALQSVLLEKRRAGHGYIGADCIAAGPREGYRELVRGGRVTDPAYADALNRRRGNEAQEKAVWGTQLFRWLLPELLAAPGGIAAVPTADTRTLSLVPALALLAGASPRSRERCLDFAEAQLTLIRHNLAGALARRQAADRPVTAELRAMEAALQRFAGHLRSAAAGASSDPQRAAQVEAYLAS